MLGEMGDDHVRAADNAPLGPGRQPGDGVPVAQPVVPGYDGKLVAHVVHMGQAARPGQQPQYPGLLVGMQDLVTAAVHHHESRWLWQKRPGRAGLSATTSPTATVFMPGTRALM